jgi:hypothetical protein
LRSSHNILFCHGNAVKEIPGYNKEIALPDICELDKAGQRPETGFCKVRLNVRIPGELHAEVNIRCMQYLK